jgi:hypothetical protein
VEALSEAETRSILPEITENTGTMDDDDDEDEEA